jgi:hypothetical protein
MLIEDLARFGIDCSEVIKQVLGQSFSVYFSQEKSACYLVTAPEIGRKSSPILQGRGSICRVRTKADQGAIMLRKRVLVTGGAGFIGSALCRHLVRETSVRVAQH